RARRPAPGRAQHPQRAAARGLHRRRRRLRTAGAGLPGAGCWRGRPRGLWHEPLADRGQPQGALRAQHPRGGRRRVKPLFRLMVLAWALAAGACATLPPEQAAAAARVAEQARPLLVDCAREDACASPSRLRTLGHEAMAASTPGSPRHHALILDYGQDALLARLSLIRSAQQSLELQTYIFDEDDAGHLFLDELLAAARRGVRVRVLVDQLSALREVETLAALAGAHANFEMRIYNPLLGRARISYPQYVLAAACCWRRLNQRMHNKLLLVDGVVGITGGRNYQNSYYDWDPEYNFRDRDLYV